MLTIITLAAIVFLMMHWEPVLALVAWALVGVVCLVGWCVFMALVTVAWFAAKHVIS